MPKANGKEEGGRTKHKLHRIKKKAVDEYQTRFNSKEQGVIEQYIQKVLSYRKIQSLRQVYQQMPMIKKYIFDSYRYGELSKVISHAPTHYGLELAIQKIVQSWF